MYYIVALCLIEYGVKDVIEKVRVRGDENSLKDS